MLKNMQSRVAKLANFSALLQNNTMGRAARRRSAKRRRMRPYTTIDGLLRAARRHALHSADTPSLPLPFRTPALRPARRAVRVVRHLSGLGAVAAKDLPAGTTLVCERALAMVLDAQVAEIEEDDDGDNADSALLIMRIASRINEEPSFVEELAMLFPRTDEELSKLRPWRCASHLQSLVDAALSTLDDSLAKRLPHIVRYNAVSCETGGELYSHATSPEALLSGIALFRDSSVFNHGNEPNVARWHCGDVVCFRTNRAVAAGEALTVSYVASPLLPDPAAARGALAHFDFVADGEEASPTVDAEAQAQLMMLSPSERLATIAQAEAAASLFADRLELTIQKAAALQASGDAGGAAEAWLTAVLAASEWLPPNDEQVAAIGVQCAKALAHADGLEAARAVLKAAYASHTISFGPGIRLFARRYERDFLLPPEAPEELLETLIT